MKNIKIFDSSLRDGAQASGISYSVNDKLNIVRALDKLGVAYIEAGNPGSNPKDIEFFKLARRLSLEHAHLVAFGSTRRKGIRAKDDPALASLLQADTSTVAVFGKVWDFHVLSILGASLTENLDMIADTISFLKENGRTVIFDAEHFFDGYKANPAYALSCLETAEQAGAAVVCLCDTNGGAFPDEIAAAVQEAVQKTVRAEIGIHTHDDGGMAVANTVMAVEAGARHVQGTLAGFGERCGNANLSTIIGNLQLKRAYHCIPEKRLPALTATVRKISEISNLHLASSMPYVGTHAFRHKAGMHIDAVGKDSKSFEHIDPHAVGNERSFVLSEIAGRSTILNKVAAFAPDVTKDSPELAAIMSKLKEMEFKGYQFEGAEGSFELLVMRQLHLGNRHFELQYYKVIDEALENGETRSTAIVKVNVGQTAKITAAEGDGPVDALDKALRAALELFYPAIGSVHLTDFKVRVLDYKSTTDSVVRVLVESADSVRFWTTMGVSKDIIDASAIALIDAMEYKLNRIEQEEVD